MPIVRVPLCQEIETRDGTLSKDSKVVNYVFETRGGKKEVLKRPGLVLAAQVINVTPPATARSQGLVSYNGKLAVVINDNLYTVDPSTFSIINVGSLAPSTSICYFVKTFLDNYLFFHNKVGGYLYSSAGILTSPASMPAAPYVSGCVFLDNYVFVGTTNNRIYNSGLSDPTTWNSLNYIAFQQTTDTLVSIAKHLNYLVAFGTTSTQFMYDNANVTGSPLSVAQSYTNEIGCANGDSVVSSDNTVFWIGTSRAHGKSVYNLEGVAPVKISTNSIDRVLERDDLSKVTAYMYRYSGHALYILTLHSSGTTLVYDLTTKVWTQWTQYALASSDQPNPGTFQEGYFRPSFYAEINSIPFCLDDDIAKLYKLDTGTYQDDGQAIYCRSVTVVYDSGTTHRKFYGRLEVVGDKISGGTIQVRHTGDDYTTWSSYRTADLGASRSQFYLGGADRRRAWEFLCTSNVPLRLEACEIDFRLGELDQEHGVG